MADGQLRWEGPGSDAWSPWMPEEVAAILRDCSAPWCVVGGWAVDLFLGRTTRPHQDIEIAVPRLEFAEIRERLGASGLYAVGQGDCVALGDAPFPTDKHQCWVLDAKAAKWRLDVMLEPGDRDQWIYRRNPVDLHAAP